MGRAREGERERQGDRHSKPKLLTMQTLAIVIRKVGSYTENARFLYVVEQQFSYSDTFHMYVYMDL